MDKTLDMHCLVEEEGELEEEGDAIEGVTGKLFSMLKLKSGIYYSG